MPDDVLVVNVVVENQSFEPATIADAVAWRDAFELTWTVLADEDGAWVDAWGNANDDVRFIQHSYTIIGSDGRVAWHRDGFTGARAEEILEALEDVP